MKLLIILAHPSPTSFNAALSDAAAHEARALGHAVQISDLYREGFSATAGAGDFLSPTDSASLHYQSEQRAAALGGSFAADIAREQQRLLWADCLMLQFPIWWGGPPAILKGWFDRVSAYGVTYADGTRFDTGLFKGRRSLVSVTTGGTPQRFTDDGGYGPIDRLLWPVQQLFLRYLGYEVLPPQVSHAVARQDDDSRKALIRSVRERVGELMEGLSKPSPVPAPEVLLESVGERRWDSAG